MPQLLAQAVRPAPPVQSHRSESELLSEIKMHVEEADADTWVVLDDFKASPLHLALNHGGRPQVLEYLLQVKLRMILTRSCTSCWSLVRAVQSQP